METITENHNWTQHKDQLISPSELSLLYLMLLCYVPMAMGHNKRGTKRKLPRHCDIMSPRMAAHTNLNISNINRHANTYEEKNL